jgi:hypothetical protein
MLLTLSPLTVIEGSGLGRTAQASKCRLVEDILQSLVAATHPFIVAGLFPGVVGSRYQSCVSGKFVGAVEGREVSRCHQELGTEQWSHPWQASEDLSLLSGEKTLLELPVESTDALLEGEYLAGEFGDDAGGDLLGGQGNRLGFSRGEGLLCESVGAFDAAVSEEGGDSLTARPADLGRSLVATDQRQSASVGKVQRPFERRERGEERISEAVDGPGLVANQVPSAGEEDLQFGKLSFSGLEFAEVGSHAGLVGDDVSIAGIGLGLSAIGVAGAVYGEAGQIDDSLLSFPQQSQKQRCGASGLIDSPDDLLGEGEGLVDESRERSASSFSTLRESSCSPEESSR